MIITVLSVNNNMYLRKNKTGFTLIELMVVILIIAILGAMGLVAYTQANRSARDGKRKSDIEMVRQALLLDKQEDANGAYLTAGSFGAITTALIGGGYLSNPAPVDPGTTSYSGSSSSTTFCICADMENNKGNATATDCGSTHWVTNNSGSYYCAAP